ncbi:Regulatory protein E2 [Clarias magur]|uniref:Regulatory protein E2 n=1 Tax=Clarias magur TaxID=1594786 RepID=A0A8J4U8N0_CLAMG|nr:Regulatory protein E2 [Clarias magur]
MPLQAQSEASVRAGRTVFGHGRAWCQATAAPVRLGSCWTSCENVAQLADGHGSAAAVGNCNNGQTHTRAALGTGEESQVSLFEPRASPQGLMGNPSSSSQPPVAPPDCQAPY